MGAPPQILESPTLENEAMSEQNAMGQRNIYIVGIGGGTGSGKTTLAVGLQERLGPEETVLIPHDAYYRDRSYLSPGEREGLNFDELAAYDNDLLIAHLDQLLSGQPVERPNYDFTSHCRRDETDRLAPRPILIVEGIMVLADPRLRRLMDLKIFVEASADLRFIRRLLRDTVERGRAIDSVITQYLETVRPMHQVHVEPTRQHADMVMSGETFDETTMCALMKRIRDEAFRYAVRG